MSLIDYLNCIADFFGFITVLASVFAEMFLLFPVLLVPFVVGFSFLVVKLFKALR